MTVQLALCSRADIRVSGCWLVDVQGISQAEDVEPGGYRALHGDEVVGDTDGELVGVLDRLRLLSLGRIANRLFIAPALRSIFQYRGDVIRLRFGTPLRSPAR